MRWWVGALLVAIFAAGLQQRVACYWKADGWMQTAADSGIYVSMAESLRYGIGRYDPSRAAEFNANPYSFRAVAPSSTLISFYQNDLGLSLLYAVAMGLFGNQASPLIELAWLQIAVDALNILLMFYIGRWMRGDPMGLLCALVYAGFSPICRMCATFPYYYYWAGCFAVWNLAFWIRLATRPTLKLALAYGLFVGMAAMVRSNFLPIGVLTAAWLAVAGRKQWRAVLPCMAALLLGQSLLTVPLLARSYARFGQLTPPRLIWHTIYVGLGAHPNPYGIECTDDAGYRLAAAHGVSRDDPDWVQKYETVLHEEVTRIRRQTPWLLPRNTLLNMADGFTYYDPQIHVTLWPLQADVPAVPAQRAVMLGASIAYGMLYMGGPPLLWLALLQGLFFLAGVSVFQPPFPTYNSAYTPTFVLLLGLLAFAAGHALKAAWEGRAVDVRVALLAGALACCFPPSSQQLYFVWNRLPYVLLCRLVPRGTRALATMTGLALLLAGVAPALRWMGPLVLISSVATWLARSSLTNLACPPAAPVSGTTQRGRP